MVDLNIKLPEHFLDEEERDGYLVSSDMKKVWAVELDLLSQFRKVCDKYGLQWYADGGTMLGVVRHKGFIPWDNDIDISMPRKDYDKLCSVAESEFLHPYFFQTARTDANYYRLHAQLRNSETTGILYCEMPKKLRFNQGVFIDIFPFDNIPDDDEELKKMCDKLIILDGRLRFHNEYTREYQPSTNPLFMKRLKHSVKHVLTCVLFAGSERSDRLFEKTESCSKSFADVDTERFANLSLPEYSISHSNYFKKEWYANVLLLPFEFTMLPVPVGYNDFLTTLYGDWHKFVVSGALHGDTFFDVDKPYKEYIP